MLLDEIGPAVFVTHGDGAVFAWVTAQERPALVKGIVAVEQSRQSLRPGRDACSSRTLERSDRDRHRGGVVLPTATDPGIAAERCVGAGCTVEHIRLADRGIRGNGPMVMMEKNNRDALRPILDWMQAPSKAAQPRSGGSRVTSGVDPNRNRESTALKLADQGGFWVGVGRKQMPYGTIAQGQMFVQYMIPAEKRYPYPVIMVHGGGAQGTHMMGLGRRPGWVHYFVQAGYSVYWLDRPSYGRSPYHPDALGPSHLPNVPPFEALVDATNVFKTGQWPGPGGMDDPFIGQFMACESGNTADEAFHSDLVWAGGVELVDRIGPCIIHGHAFGGFFGWGVADRRPAARQGHPVHGDQRQSLRAPAPMGPDGEPDDLRSAGDRSQAVHARGPNAAAGFAAADRVALQAAGRARAQVEEPAADSHRRGSRASSAPADHRSRTSRS